MVAQYERGREKLKEITLVIMSYILNFRQLATSLPPNFWFTSYYKPLGSLVEKKRYLSHIVRIPDIYAPPRGTATFTRLIIVEFWAR